MKKNKRFSVFVLSVLCCVVSGSHVLFAKDIFTDNSRLAINNIEYNSEQIKQFGLFELSIDLSADYDNPFDPAQIKVLGHFIAPSQVEVVVPGFFFQDFARRSKYGKEYLDKAGNPLWKIRFTPVEVGVYHYYLEVKNRTRILKSTTAEFSAGVSASPGFISIDKKSIYYMKFTNGSPYFAVGESISWTSPKQQTYGYDYYFDKLAANGCNYSRVWLVEWNLVLEWKDYEKTKGKAHGLGKYSLDNSWRLDYIIELAKEHGIYLLLTLDTYGSIMDEKGFWGEARWNVNPYNAKNGGPCKTPDDFWTNKNAKEIYKRRLRYILSRWGHSPNILAFELWNEVDSPKAWVEEMARYIKRKDPYDHLVTTSIGYPFGDEYKNDASAIWGIDDIDYTQTHLYGDHGSIIDLAKAISDKCILMTDKYKKPHIIAEFGLDFSADDIRYDKNGKGTHLHNALWASVMSRSFGTAMTHWKEYVDKKDLYSQFERVSGFLDKVGGLKGRWRRMDVRDLKCGALDDVSSDLVLLCEGDWGEGGGEDITVTRDGKVKGKINRYIHGMTKQGELRFIPIFHLDYPRDGKFILDVGTVSQGADLHIYMDGEEIWHHSFSAGPGKGEWKSSKFNKQYKIYMAKYDKKYTINIPKGRHDIRIENTGKDWVSLRAITLTGYRDKNIPFVRVLGLTKEHEAVLWIQNKASTWYNAYNNTEILPVKELSFNITGLSDGLYEIQWWDTWNGGIIRVEKNYCKGNKLPVKILELPGDIACYIRKIP